MPEVNQIHLLLVMAAYLVYGQMPPGKLEFQFRKEQFVYVVGAESLSRNLTITSANLELERKAKEQFRKEKVFRIAKTLAEADFVFFILIDSNSDVADEIALAILPSDYKDQGTSLDTLRAKAIWQETAHFKRGRNAALAGATIGLSGIFHRPSVSKGLVKKFHQDTFRSRP
jgi:hypothetical protein